MLFYKLEEFIPVGKMKNHLGLQLVLALLRVSLRNANP